MSTPADRRWAELARDQQFTQLAELRKQAEGWRTGLTGLTALLAVLVVLKGKDSLSGLPPHAAYTASGLLGAAFVMLLVGDVLSIRAAHGWPKDENPIGGQLLRVWTRQETIRVAANLRHAARCCVVGLLLAGAAVAVSWTHTEDSGADAPLIQVRTTSGTTVCGEFVSAGPRGTVVLTREGRAPRLTTVATGSLLSAGPVADCQRAVRP